MPEPTERPTVRGEPPDATPSGHRSKTGILHITPDRHYDTALSPRMKSHLGFQQGNFLHALAPCELAAPSSVLVLAHVIDHEGAIQDKSHNMN